MKAKVIVDQNLTIKMLCDELDSFADEANKEHKEFVKRVNETKDILWDKIENEMKKQGIIPLDSDYSFFRKDGVIYQQEPCKNCGNDHEIDEEDDDDDCVHIKSAKDTKELLEMIKKDLTNLMKARENQ